MKALSRCKDAGWWEQRGTSFLVTLIAYFIMVGVAFLGYTIYQMLPPMDWEDILKTFACVFFFCVNWWLIDNTINN